MDPQSFIARAEAQRWLGIAEKLLISHDLVGSKTFAIRARESDPRLEAAEQILVIADTLLAAEKRVVGTNGAHQPDYYAILQLVRFVQDTDHIASQYRRLAVALNPHQNRFPYSDQAFQLVNEAWAVLSNPMQKSMYDSDLDYPQEQQMNNLGFNLEQQHHQQQQQPHNFFSINQELPEQQQQQQQQTFQSRLHHSHQHQQLQQHNFLSQPNPVRPLPVREQEHMFQHREQEQLFQPQVQPFQVTSPPHQQARLSPQPQQHIQSPPATSQPPFSWPQASQMSQPQQQIQHQHQHQVKQEQQHLQQVKQEQQLQKQIKQEHQKQQQMQQEQLKQQQLKKQQQLQQEQLKQQQLEQQQLEQLKQQRLKQQQLQEEQRKQQQLQQEQLKQQQLMEEQLKQQQLQEEQRKQQQFLEEQRKQQQLQEEQRKQQQLLEEQRKQQQLLEEQRKQQQLLEEQRKQQQLLEEQRKQQQLLEEQRKQQQLLEEQRKQQQLLEEQRKQQQLLEEQRKQQQLLEEQRKQQQLQEEQRKQQQLLEEQQLQEEQRKQQQLLEEQRKQQQLQEEQSKQQQLQEEQRKQQLQKEQQQQESVRQNAAPVQVASLVNSNNGVREEETETEPETEVVDDSPTFWTACPYCFYMYEYPKVYIECTLRCDNCKRAFQAVRISSPPPIIEGQDAYFYCWGFIPVGLSISHQQKNNNKGTNSNWTPFSSLHNASTNVQNHLNEQAAPKEKSFVNKSSGPRIYIDDITDDVFIRVSEPSSDSDTEWVDTKKQKSKTRDKGFKERIQVLALRAMYTKNMNVKNLKHNIPLQKCVDVPTVLVVETSKINVGSNPRKQSGRVAQELGKLDLNVEFNNNGGEENAPRLTGGTRVHEQGEEDSIEEGIEFFEGLDEYLSSLPILSVVNEEKVKAA